MPRNGRVFQPCQVPQAAGIGTSRTSCIAPCRDDLSGQPARKIPMDTVLLRKDLEGLVLIEAATGPCREIPGCPRA
ncbi:hypothetical protein NUTIK01_13290 [Novosphingobium sp. IK01]|uniref:Uncharacterized protein n=1 Tax=Novosphingobium pituita TaxID=3056842 RepID=A0ABQ6P838_9SPHN|nr:hypothetical protein NUTIK01_13290 [Novosphingobium sp. IK01]